LLDVHRTEWLGYINLLHESALALDQWIEMGPIPVTDSFSGGFEQFPKLRKDSSKNNQKKKRPFDF
jgi:hypothetical protein